MNLFKIITLILIAQIFLTININAQIAPGSTLTDANDEAFLASAFGGTTYTGTLIYSSDIHGFDISTFHTLCDSYGTTIVIYKNSLNGEVFGGYSSIPWGSSQGYHHSPGSFLFNLTNNFKLNGSIWPQWAVYTYSQYFPTFGGGHDIFLGSMANPNSQYCNPHSYQSPTLYGQNYIHGGTNSNDVFVTQIEVYAIAPLVATTWTGATNSDWFTTSNWSPSINPNTANNITIPDVSGASGNFPVIASATTLGKITVEAGASLTVATGIVLDGAFTNNGTVTLQDGAYLDDFTNSGTASYAGEITVERLAASATAGNNQRFISSAVNTPPISEIGDDLNGPWGTGLPGTDGVAVTIDDCALQTSASTSNYGNLFEFNETLIATCALDGWVVRSTGNLTNGAGYSAYLPSGSTFDLTGTPNTGDVDVDVTNSGTLLDRGWNLIGNPYPSPISRDNIITSQAADIQYYVASGLYQGSFAAYLPGENIAIGQGFQMFTAATQTIQLNNTMRRTGPSTWYSSGAWYDHKLEVSVFGNNGADKTILFYNYDASSNYEAMYDVNKRDSDLGNPTLSTFSANKNLALNGLNTTNLGETVPMNFKAGTNGNFSLNFEGLETFGNTTIYVKDLQENIVHNIENGDYNFTATTSENEERFELIFVPEVDFSTTKVDCEGNLATLSLENVNINTDRSYELSNTTSVLAFGDLDLLNESLEAGTYTLDVFDAFGGFQSYNFNIEKLDKIDATFNVSNTELQIGEILELNNTTINASNIEWEINDIVIQNVNNATYTFEETGSYEVILKVNNSECSDSKSQMINVINKTTGIQNVTLSNNLSIHPNPAKNILNINYNQSINVKFYNILGEKVLVTNKKAIIVDNLNSGIYYLSIYNDSNELISINKFVKE